MEEAAVTSNGKVPAVEDVAVARYESSQEEGEDSLMGWVGCLMRAEVLSNCLRLLGWARTAADEVNDALEAEKTRIEGAGAPVDSSGSEMVPDEDGTMAAEERSGPEEVDRRRSPRRPAVVVVVAAAEEEDNDRVGLGRRADMVVVRRNVLAAAHIW